MVQTHGPSTDSSLPRGVGTCLEPRGVHRGSFPGAAWGVEGVGISVAGEGWVMSVRQGQEEKKKSWAYGDMGTVFTSHPPFAEGLCRTGKGIEESTMDPAKGSSGFGNSLQRHRAVMS